MSTKTTSLVFLLALVVQLPVLAFQSWLLPDSSDYLRLAQALVETGSYGTLAQPELFRAPGYPTFLAVFQLLRLPLAAVIAVQILLGAGSCVLAASLAQRLFDAKTALATGVIAAGSVVNMVYAGKILSETLFCCLFMAALLLLWEVWQRHQLAWLPVAGLILSLAAAAYVRAVLLPFLALPLLLLLWRGHWRQALLVAVGVGLLLAPWYVRNAHHGYPHFSSVGAVNLYRYNACMLLASQNKVPFATQQAQITAELELLPDQAEVGRVAATKGAASIISAPLTYSWLHLKTIPVNLLPAAGDLLGGFGARIGGVGTLQVIADAGVLAGVKHYFGGKWHWLLLALLPAAWLAAMYLAAAAGMISAAWRWELSAYALFLLVTIAYFLAVPGAAAHPRFRIPAMPLLAIFAARGYCLATEAWRRRTAK